MKSNLVIHSGGHVATLAEIEDVELPRGTRTHTPIGHGDFFHLIEENLEHCGLGITDVQHCLSKGGDRYFGLIGVEIPSLDYGGGYEFVVGIRNSHDKSFSAGVVAGSSVFCCDNLAFSGEIRVAEKHTGRLMDILPGEIQRASEKLPGLFTRQNEQYESYKEYEISDRDAHDFMVKAAERGVIPFGTIEDVLSEWRSPSYPDFNDPNAWSLFNDFTTVMKKTDVFIRPKQTMALHSLMDKYIGLN